MGSKEILELFIKEGNLEIDIETMIEVSFSRYKKNQTSIEKYNLYDFIPQNLIKLYYSRDNNRSDFSDIMANFKKRYIEQESKLEGAHTIEEIEGLGLVYDYIRSDEWQQCPNIYILLMINLKLFSLTPCPEAGGHFRNTDCIIRNSGINAFPYNQISTEIAKMYSVFDELLNFGKELNNNNCVDTEDKIIDYIDACLRLKCHLIEIHPFPDGNGRTTRALVNLLFKVAGLPPIYVRATEKQKYLTAMNKAIVEKDYSYINKFYYYKICDSILQLDVNKRIKKGTKLRTLKLNDK